MALKDHRDPNATISGPIEYFYTWWHPEDPDPLAVGKLPGFRGYWSWNKDTTAARTAHRRRRLIAATSQPSAYRTTISVNG